MFYYFYKILESKCSQAFTKEITLLILAKMTYTKITVYVSVLPAGSHQPVQMCSLIGALRAGMGHAWTQDPEVYQRQL